jgi:hypothetical protein
MTMATLIKRETPSPRYKGTVVCNCCHAEYSPGAWCRGLHCGQDTQNHRFVKIADVREGHCPVCDGKN